MAEISRKLGIEEEFALLDAETGAPAPGSAARLIGAAHRRTRLEHEFLDSQVEIATVPCDTAAAAETELRQLRGEAAGLAREHGLVLAASGTPPIEPTGGDGPAVTPTDRYRMIANDARRVARSHYVNGMHVHVSIESDDAGIRAINGLAQWAPLLLAMTGNSPLWAGTDTGFQSWRHLIGCSWPLNVFPARFANAAEYHERVTRLIQSGLIRDRALVSWVVRLSASFPTIELRLADVQLRPEAAVAFAALVRALVDRIVADPDSGAAEGAGLAPGPDEVNAALWCAARDGLARTLVDPVRGREVEADVWLEELLAYARPSLERCGDTERVERYIAGLREHGAPAEAQRRVFQEGGIPALLELYDPALTVRERGPAPRDETAAR